MLRGVRVGDFADTLFRAAAFARVAAAGRAHLDHGADSTYASDVSAARLMTMATSSSTPPGWSSTAASAERRATGRLVATGVHGSRTLGHRVGPRQPRVPQLAATSGHAP